MPPQDWKSHKAELDHYVAERKPLDEVRDLLREKHGIHASKRLYRKRVGLGPEEKSKKKKKKKNNNNNNKNNIIIDRINKSASGHQRARSTSRRPSPGLPPPRLTLDGPDTETGPSSPRTLETRARHLSERGPFAVMSAYEKLLTRWQPQGESALLCVQHPKFDEWVQRSNPDNGPILFKLIQVLVPPEEQHMLNKAFLEEDLRSHGNPDYPFEAWRYAWRSVLRCQDLEEEEEEEEEHPDDDGECEATYCSEDWENAKEMLRADATISQVAGQRFLDCALVVMAERRLTACKNDPSHWKRRKYLDVLKDFRHLDADVDPSFYKDSLQIIEMEEQDNLQPSKQRRSDLADEYRQKYLQLVNRCTPEKRGISRPAVCRSDISTSSGWSSPSHRRHSPALASDHYPSPSTTNHDPSVPAAPIPVASAVFSTLVTKWKTLNDFIEYAHSLLALDGWTLSIFKPSPAGAPNLFDQITSALPSTERVPLISALLLAFSSTTTTTTTGSAPPWILRWWSSIHASPTWELYEASLDLCRGILQSIMSPAAAKSFLDAVVLLVGEKILLDIKTRLVKAKKKRSGSGRDELAERTACKVLESQYMEILGEFYARGLKVDPTWTYYLMNVI
ncbi:uncharacterized protein L3040_005279 [Drepanopeziza brunnea f. sp. 'multigermtubi']|uniref:Clr5 domain-containing protein n=1 Tax=Marssonina brunnea f. sp. multigermtubi (strain MB_m1) TaxID=1072389 RepID=K1W6S6_MARBU|nr:uncharacterized protein MBM_09264 [Drepanopeziza brunnea f. sp. 'multigermtubi' MB_m1]EKD12695.1 hypothetical protein MBM_09264 [Drepanopeziza brunnea f. sp. 'multigermtubi' MB_m1]KAJ5041709.1 hypothetical protein L3040_005279 [Drepanopeziza brunnea f. sp. 'multigermtubi']